MNDSVIFVKRIAKRDSDVYVIEDDDLLFQNDMESSGRIKKTNSQPVAYIDLSQDTTESLAKDSQVSTEIQNHTVSNNTISFECSICLNPIHCLNLKSLHCGHVFCTVCIDRIMQNSKVRCPKCRKITFKKNLRSVFL